MVGCDIIVLSCTVQLASLHLFIGIEVGQVNWFWKNFHAPSGGG